MLWKTHLRISFEVLRRLGISLSDEVDQSFRNGILAPDQWQDYPHHYGKSHKIRENLMRSRGYFLRDDLPNAFFHLGVALHYIQDSYTSMASSYFKHHIWEECIEDANFVDDLDGTISYSLRNNGYERDRCLRLANTLSRKAEGRDSTLYMATLTGYAASQSFSEPIVDLNLGLRASHVVTESVLSSKNCTALESKLADVLSRFEAVMVAAETELSDKIIRLVNERDALKKRKLPHSGIVPVIRNWVLGIRIGLKDFAAKSNNSDYIQRKHIKKVFREYVNAAKATAAPYSGWFNFQIPGVSPQVVRKELLSVCEIARFLSEKEDILQESLDNVRISTYRIGDSELVKRSELDRFLSHFPVNGFTKSPL
jgi:hypothetical protein